MVCIPDHCIDSVKYTLHLLNVSARLLFTESWLGAVTEQFYAGSMFIESDSQRALQIASATLCHSYRLNDKTFHSRIN